ncbi:MAG TPA: YiiD C-terminal domain-containing protein [Anaeromyxobacter sp.]
MTLDEITAYLHEHMPITRGLGARVAAYDGLSVRLAAPLAPNLNHFGSAYGGSLSAVAILSGWVLLYLQLRERGIANRVVIQRSALDFASPVDGDFTATSVLPPPAAWDRFLATLARHHAARVTVSTTLACASGVGGRHEGTYVATRL